MAGELICVLGDAHLDVVVRRFGEVAADSDTPASTSLGVGGQAANVAAWVAALGGRSRLIAARAGDLAAGLVAAELASRGVELVGPVISGRTGVVVALSDGTARSMLSDRGVGPLLAAGAIEPGWLDGCVWLHLSAYSLVREPARGAAFAAARSARARSARISLDLSSTAAIAEYGVDPFFRLMRELGPDLVLGNEAEAALLGVGQAGQGLIGELPGTELIVKLGARGVLAGGRVHPAAPAEAADATGAGDAFAAGYLVGGVALGLSAAARAVATIGAMP